MLLESEGPRSRAVRVNRRAGAQGEITMNTEPTITCSESLRSEKRDELRRASHRRIKPAGRGPISAALLIVLAASTHTYAQFGDFYSSPGYTSLISSLIDNHIWKASMSRYTDEWYRRNPSGSRRASSAPAAAAPPPQIPAYRRYPAVQFKSTGTRLTLDEYLASVNVSPKKKAEVKELVLKILKDFETQAAAKGYPNDWALAYVSYVGLNSHVYHGRTEKPLIQFEQNIGLRDVAAEYATSHRIFDGVADRKKQELYELMIMLSGLTYHFYEKALKENNAEEIQGLRASAGQHLKLIGIKP